MAKSFLYECYAYIMVNHIHNSYPIRNPKNHLESIFALKEGDKLYIKGIGYLRYEGRYVSNYDYKEDGREGLYQEIGLKCITIN